MTSDGRLLTTRLGGAHVQRRPVPPLTTDEFLSGAIALLRYCAIARCLPLLFHLHIRFPIIVPSNNGTNLLTETCGQGRLACARFFLFGRGWTRSEQASPISTFGGGGAGGDAPKGVGPTIPVFTTFGSIAKNSSEMSSYKALCRACLPLQKRKEKQQKVASCPAAAGRPPPPLPLPREKRGRRATRRRVRPGATFPHL